MRFGELPLYRAIVKAYGTVERPRGTEWLIHDYRDLYKRIVDQMTDFTDGVPWKQTEVLEAWETYGKGSNVNGNGDNKIDLLVHVAAWQADRCFYAGRGKGECSEEVDLDRIVPGSRNGQYTTENCVLSCSKHNRERQDKSIEDFLADRLVSA